MLDKAKVLDHVTHPPPTSESSILTLKGLITTAADDIHKYFSLFFREKNPVKFQNDRPKPVGGVAQTRYLLQIRNHTPCTTEAQNSIPLLFFEKAGDKNG